MKVECVTTCLYKGKYVESGEVLEVSKMPTKHFKQIGGACKVPDKKKGSKAKGGGQSKEPKDFSDGYDFLG